MSIYDLTSRNTNASVWENPNSSSDLLRVTRQTQPKKLGVRVIDNVKTEISVTRRKDPRDSDCYDVCAPTLENLSVRLSMSGSAANAAELGKMFDTIMIFAKTNRDRLLAGQTLPITTEIVIDPVYTITPSAGG